MVASKAGITDSKPSWLRRKIAGGSNFGRVASVLTAEALNTVCVSARCPNRGECFSAGTATFMIMGNICTRNCAFCAVDSGIPLPLREDEPEAVARASMHLNLEHVVVTSVTRDDLPDGGSEHFVKTIRSIRTQLKDVTVEVLTPDFNGDLKAVQKVLEGRPDVFNHNIETVERLYPDIRPKASYRRSLDILRIASERGLFTKSGLMVGLGETEEEITQTLLDLRESGCQALTVGQYLQPKRDCVPVKMFYSLKEFEDIERMGYKMGFACVFSGPFVRSSYKAEQAFKGSKTIGKQENDIKEEEENVG